MIPIPRSIPSANVERTQVLTVVDPGAQVGWQSGALHFHVELRELCDGLTSGDSTGAHCFLHFIVQLQDLLYGVGMVCVVKSCLTLATAAPNCSVVSEFITTDPVMLWTTRSISYW